MTTDDEGMPLWVKIVGAATLLLIGSFVVLALVGDGFGDHGPDRHAPSTDQGITEGMPAADPSGPGSWPACGVQPAEDAGPGPASGVNLAPATICST